MKTRTKIKEKDHSGNSFSLTFALVKKINRSIYMISTDLKYKAVLFDLDGTLINSLQDIADSMNRVLASYGFSTHGYEDYRLFIGKGLKNLSERALPENKKDEETINAVFHDLMKDYARNVVKKTVLYNGIPELLDKLVERNILLAILSNKAHELTISIAEKIISKWNFEVIMGSKDGIPRKPDPSGALICCKELGVLPEQILYLGDSGIDMQTATAAGMFPVGVTWGFRGREELLEKGAKFIIDQPVQLLELL